jgi:hypothetical protein
VANDEPRREQPRELFPEWTTRPHAPHALKDLPLPGTPRSPWIARPPRASWRAVTVILLSLIAVIGLVIFRVDGRRSDRSRTQTGPANAEDAQLEQAARDRVAADPELARLPCVVIVRDQVVSVSGQAPDATTRDRLLYSLRMTPGVKGVVDRTTIATER